MRWCCVGGDFRLWPGAAFSGGVCAVPASSFEVCWWLKIIEMVMGLFWLFFVLCAWFGNTSPRWIRAVPGKSPN